MRIDRRLTEAEKLDAREALRRLDGSGMSLAQAVAIALKQPGGAPRRVAPGDAVEQFLLASMRRGCRARTQQFYREQLERWVMECGAAHLDEVSRPALRAYLEGMPVSPGSVGCRHRAIRALYRWARRQEPPLCATDPTEGLVLELPSAPHKVEFFSPAEAATMLAAAGEHAPALALALFAGIRPEELGGFTKPRMRWEDVDCVSRIVRVPAEVSKTNKSRVIEGLPPALWMWLQSDRRRGTGDRRQKHGPILTINWQPLVVRLKPLLADGWKQDGTRHSFATYALALTSDPGKVSLWLGHEGSPTLLYRHYRGLATFAQAKAFFGLRPVTTQTPNTKA
jgi:integrase